MADGRVESGVRHRARRVGVAALLVLLIAGIGGIFAVETGSIALGGPAGASVASSAIAPTPSASLTAAVETPSLTPALTAAPTAAPTAKPAPAPSPGASSAPPIAHEEPFCRVAAPVLAVAKVDAAMAKKLQARLDKTRTALSVPGVSVAIVWDSGLTWTGTSGHADIAADVPVTAGTAFSLASISKTLTAAVVLELVAEGKIALDEPASHRLRAYGLDNRITIRMLLDHTSGLPDFFTTTKADAALGKSDAVWTAAMSWSFVPKYHRIPGSAYIYSNTNYVLLGELIRAVTGNPPAVEIRRRLLEPLHLDHTWYQQEEAPLAPMPASYMLRWFGGVPAALEVAPSGPVVPFRSVVTASGAAGSMAGTALDTARWMSALAGGHVLPPEMLKAMLDDQATTLALGAEASYGLGISTVNMAGHPGLGHSGRFLGARNVVRYLPDLKLTVAVMTNQREVDPALFGADLVKTITAAGEIPAAPSLPVCSPTTARRR